MEEPLKHLMQELGNAINDSLSESDRIAEAIGQIKQAGYDVFLVLEATIGFNKRDENEGVDDEEEEGRRSPRDPAGTETHFRTGRQSQIHVAGSALSARAQDFGRRRPALNQFFIR